MSKKEDRNIFPSLLEKVLVDIWGGVGDRLDTLHLKKTRAAISYIRRVYRHKGEHGTIQPSKINYEFKKNRAVYLLLFAIPVVIIPCAYSWFIEYKAEAETFKKLGIETVLEIDSTLPARSKAPVFWRIVNRMTHPPPKLVEKIYRRFNHLNYEEQKP